MSKKILIIGNSAREYSLAKYLSKNNEIYVAPGSNTIEDFATCVDIREDSVSEILEFVLENDIKLTITSSKKSIESNLADILTKNNQAVFGPTKNAAKHIIDKALMKKTLYKLRIPTPKFGIFEKQNMAIDYIKNMKAPFVIKTNEPSSAVVLTTHKQAKNILETAFSSNNAKVIIEDFIWGTPFTFYAITDGYKALPFGSSIIYKHSLEGNGGQLTNGMGACSPNYKLSFENEYFLMDNIIYPLLEHLETEGSPYIGIIGVNGILTEDNNIQVLGFEHFTQDCDTSSIFELIDYDLYTLFEACTIGSFSDVIDIIPQKDLATTSLVITCRNKNSEHNSINGLANLDEETLISYYPNIIKNKYLEIEAQTGPVLVLTCLGRTVSTSTSKAYNEAKEIDFKGIYYRQDICKATTSSI